MQVSLLDNNSTVLLIKDCTSIVNMSHVVEKLEKKLFQPTRHACQKAMSPDRVALFA